MSTTFTLDTATSRANPTPAPMKRLTVPAIRTQKGGVPLVMLTAYTVRTAQLLDPHCDMLLVSDKLQRWIAILQHFTSSSGNPHPKTLHVSKSLHRLGNCRISIVCDSWSSEVFHSNRSVRPTRIMNLYSVGEPKNT